MALVGLLAFIVSVKAQGWFVEDTSQVCEGKDWQILGCYKTTTQPFAFFPSIPPPTGGDIGTSYIYYDQNDNVNSTMTPNGCTDFCRHHGFRYAGLWNNLCSCGSTLTEGPTTLSDQDASKCGDVCDGDSRETCGSDAGARIFVDTSYIKTVANPAAGYKKLGCFQSANFPGASSLFQKTVTSASECLTYCGTLNLALASMLFNDAGGDST